MFLNSEGIQKELACFAQDDTTQAWESCAISWNNQLFIFGGMFERRQISRLTGHKLEKVGSLDFDHKNGACSVMANSFIYLCFNDDYDDHYRCRRSTGPLEQFSTISLSNHRHSSIRTSSQDSKL